jgi:putative transposase
VGGRSSPNVVRKQRDEYPGSKFHVWMRRVDRWPLFVDEEDYRRYVALLVETVEQFGWRIIRFCLMPNHVHLLIELTEPNFAAGLHHVHRAYVRAFNDRHSRTGRLFEHRPQWKAVEDELYFVTVKQYIEQNPVSGGLCDRPEDWPWAGRDLAPRT